MYVDTLHFLSTSAIPARPGAVLNLGYRAHPIAAALTHKQKYQSISRDLPAHAHGQPPSHARTRVDVGV